MIIIILVSILSMGLLSSWGNTSNKSGNKIQSPMAVVALGGLLTSTLLNIYILPIVYELFQIKKMKK